MSEPRGRSSTAGDATAETPSPDVAGPVVPELPVILLATSHDDSRAVLDAELRRRYATDY